MKIKATFLDEISHDIPHQNWGERVGERLCLYERSRLYDSGRYWVDPDFWINGNYCKKVSGGLPVLISPYIDGKRIKVN